jgi:phosphate transport system permease protein
VNNPFRATRRNIGELIAEWSIRAVASLSIIVIFLIFIFVFREASTLLTGSDDVSTEQTSTSSQGTSATSTTESEPDVYNPDAEEPEVYNPEAEAPASGEEGAPGEFIYIAANPAYPHIYNPSSGLIPPDIDATSSEEEVVAGDTLSFGENFLSSTWQPVGEVSKFGIVPLLIGTAKTTFIAILIGAPLGILAALFVAFFAKPWIREIVKPGIELLAGFPSVVIGFFCLVTVASWVQDVTGVPYRLNAIVGGIGLSLAVIPIVFSIAEDALSAVPKTLREASLALGSTEWQTAYRVMLPAAAPGVFAAVLLGIGRAFGETMIAIMATGNAPLSSFSPFEPARTVAATIGSEMGEVVWGSEHYGVLFLLGVLLFVFSFGLNAVTELYVKTRFIKRFQGK